MSDEEIYRFFRKVYRLALALRAITELAQLQSQLMEKENHANTLSPPLVFKRKQVVRLVSPKPSNPFYGKGRKAYSHRPR